MTNDSSNDGRPVLASAGDDPSVTGALIRFGVFELDVRSGELRRQGIRVRLQDKPRQVLLALLERPGEIVTRQELRQRLWSDDVFVDFDSGLNTAANRLRLTLGDAAASPRFVETLPRVGYRFIAPIERVERLPRATTRPADRPHTPWRRPLAFGLMTVTGVAIVVMGIGRLDTPPAMSTYQFRPITFARGNVLGARFGPGGTDVIYSATWNGTPLRLYAHTPGAREPRPLHVTDRRLVAVSRQGALALLDADGTLPIAGGTLLRSAMTDGTPTIVERHIMAADWWGADRFTWARAVEGVNRLEVPAGRPVHQTSGWIGGVRSSPDGTRVAFIEHPVRHEDGGALKVTDGRGTVRTVADGWTDIGGLAWHPVRHEVWFSATRDGTPKAIWAVAPDDPRTLRRIASAAGSVSLRDISPDGRLLVSTETVRLEMATNDAAGRPRDISLHDSSRVADLSGDGRLVLFDESGAASGADHLIYLRDLVTGATRHLGSGRAMALTPAEDAVLALDAKDPRVLRRLSLAGAPTSTLPAVGLEYQWVRYFPDGRTLLALANEPGQPLRVYVQPADRPPFPLTSAAMVRHAAIAPDGRKVALLAAGNTLLIYPADGGEPERVPGGTNLAPLVWTPNGLFVQHLGAYTQIPTYISRLDLRTGRPHPWGSVAPGDAVGVNAITKVMLARDERTVVFNYRRALSVLFIGETAAR